MKRLIKSLAALALVVSMQGCSYDSLGEQTTSSKVELKLRGEIQNLKTGTRVSESGFDANDDVGVYVSMTDALAQQNNTLDNVAFTYNNGSLEAPEGKEVYWGSDNVKLSVWAYYPYAETISDNTAYAFSVNEDQSTKEKFYNSDFITASATNLPSQSEAVDLEFNHSLSKIAITFVGEGITPEDLSNAEKRLAINGMVVDGTINLADGVATTGQTTASITPYKVDGLNYDAIVYPQSGKLSLRMEMGGEIYTYSTPVEYEAGYQYKYTLKINVREPNQLTLVSTSINGWEDGDDPVEDDMVDIITFTDPNFEAYLLQETLYIDGVASGKIDANTDGVISIAEAERVEKIDIDGERCGFEITGLSELHYFVNLKSLNCTGQELDQIDVSKNTALIEFDCGANNLTTLDVSMLTELELLRCGYNQLINLDVSANRKLHTLECNNNLLTVLGLSNNINLETLLSHTNQLTSLDVSKNTELSILYCGQNLLETLDVSTNMKLNNLYCVPMNDEEGNNLLETIYLADGVTIESMHGVDIPEETEIKYKDEN